MPLRGSYRLQSVLRSGLLVPVTCSEACNVKVELFISASAARRLGLPAARRLVLVGRASTRVAAPGTVRVRVKLKPNARRAMRSVRKIGLTVRATATDLAGNTRVVKRTVTLKRRP